MPTRGETWFYVKAADPAISNPPEIGDHLPGTRLLTPSSYNYDSMGGTWSVVYAAADDVEYTYDGEEHTIEVIFQRLTNPVIKYGETEGSYP